MSTSKDPVVSFRLRQALLDELEELAPLIQKLPEYRGATLNRSTLLQIATSHGVARLRAVLAKHSGSFEQIDLLDPPQQNLIDDK